MQPRLPRELVKVTHLLRTFQISAPPQKIRSPSAYSSMDLSPLTLSSIAVSCGELGSDDGEGTGSGDGVGSTVGVGHVTTTPTQRGPSEARTHDGSEGQEDDAVGYSYRPCELSQDGVEEEPKSGDESEETSGDDDPSGDADADGTSVDPSAAIALTHDAPATTGAAHAKDATATTRTTTRRQP